MLATALPIIPFYILPRKSWKSDQEKKERVEFEIEEDDGEEEEEKSFVHAHTDRNKAIVNAARQDDRTVGSSTVLTGEYFGSSNASVSSLGTKSKQPQFDDDDSEYDPLEANAQSEENRANIAELVKVNPLLAEMYDNGPPEKLNIFRIGPFSYAYQHFIRWKENVRKNRMHYMIRNYYLKALQEAEDARIFRANDLAKKEHDMLVESYRSEKRIKAAKYKDSRKYQAASWLTAAIEKKDKEAARMEYNCYNFQIWAVENHERKLLEVEAEKVRKEAVERERITAEKKAEFDRVREIDAAVLEDDVALSQEVIATMRKTGVLPGINVEARGNLFKTDNNTKKYVELRIADTLDMSKSGTRKMRSKDYVSPFTTDLAECRQVNVLRCYDIGEFGAIALGAEIIRGVCNHLTHLDLSMCGCKTRGFGKLMYGLRVGGLVTLHTLKLKHNQLTSKVLLQLQECFKAGTLDLLRVLDLGYNELGDEGARILSHMYCDKANYLAQIEQINLQGNGITDIGFVKLVKILVNVKDVHAPQLEYLCLRNNHISGQIRAQYTPIPSYISL